MTPTAVPGGIRTSQAREAAPFDRVELHDPVNLVDLVVGPGDHPTLVIEGPPEMLHRVHTEVRDGTLRITLSGSVAEHIRDAFTTSLGRQLLVYRIRAPRLREVRVAGRVRVAVHAFGADAPVVTRLEPHAPDAPAPPEPAGPPR